ncbi:hypothetical protein [Sinomonas humi]|uniref:DUF8175 domain-containing protein n=1 Tax=Sinomonas humi TaxID=1338436 RepID=A0A0B2AIS9_9MICC|nr:hypothetical protein [Sinomonas humi]KHL01751.1 hypothetical protein LK10_14850 [Sinomonas humi]
MGLKSFSRSQYDAVAHPEKMDGGQLSRTRWALVVLGVVLVAGAVILAVLTNQPQGQKGAGPAPVPTISYSPSADDTTGAGRCLDNTPKDITTTAPPVQQWVVKGWAAVPVVKGAGPCGKPVGGVDTGFAKTATGALVASLTWGSELQEGRPNAGTADAIRAVVVPGADRDSILARVSRIRSGAEAPAQDPAGVVRIVGYKVNLDGDTARVDFQLKIQTSGGVQDGLIPTRLQWLDGDWKMVPTSGNDLARAVPLNGATGFVPFIAGGTS